MEQKEEMPTPDFLKGFNEGYLMASNEPELSEKLAGALGNSERAQGFQGGRKQYLDEVRKERYPAWLTRESGERREEEKQKSKDDIEKDKDL